MRNPGIPFFLLSVLISIVTGNPALAQLQKPHSANRAALYSAILPGAGQAYNKKYWKIPVVYAGFGTLYYFISTNNKEYHKFKDAFDYKTQKSPDPALFNQYVDKYPLSSLRDGRDYYRRNRDLSIIITAVWYILTITDAAVDAYLFDYDVGNDLSLQLAPFVFPASKFTTSSQGLTLILKF